MITKKRRKELIAKYGDYRVRVGKACVALNDVLLDVVDSYSSDERGLIDNILNAVDALYERSNQISDTYRSLMSEPVED